MIKLKYEAPELEMFEMQVERGFAQSSIGAINAWETTGDNKDDAWGDE